MPSSFKQFMGEMAFNVSTPLNHTDKELSVTSQFFLHNGEEPIEIEDGDYTVIKHDDHYGIFNYRNQFLGYATLKPQGEFLNLAKVYIDKKFRNEKVAKTLLFWIKTHYKKSIMIDGPIFNGSEEFLTSLTKDPRFSTCIYDPKTKEKVPFNRELLTSRHDIGMLLECWEETDGSFDFASPGNDPKIKNLSLFKD